jgi:hypothetical protein
LLVVVDPVEEVFAGLGLALLATSVRHRRAREPVRCRSTNEL